MYLDTIIASSIYSLACSSGLNFLSGGPPLLPSPAMGPFESSRGAFILHFWRKSSGALFSKQSAIYWPRIGRNLNPLK